MAEVLVFLQMSVSQFWKITLGILMAVMPVSHIALADPGQKTAPNPQPRMGVKLRLELKTTETYEKYDTVSSSSGVLHQYYGDQGYQTLKVTGRGLVDSLNVALQGEVEMAAPQFMKAIDVEVDFKGRRKYSVMTPKSADYKFLGNNSALKRLCFRHLNPIRSVWAPQKRLKKDQLVEEIFPAVAEDVFSYAQAVGPFQLPKTKLLISDVGFEFSLEALPSRVWCREVKSPQGVAGASKDLLQCIMVTGIDLILAMDERSTSEVAPMILGKLGGYGMFPGASKSLNSLIQNGFQRPQNFQGWLNEIIMPGMPRLTVMNPYTAAVPSVNSILDCQQPAFQAPTN